MEAQKFSKDFEGEENAKIITPQSLSEQLNIKFSDSVEQALIIAENIRLELVGRGGSFNEIYSEFVLMGMYQKERGATIALLSAFGLTLERYWLWLEQKNFWKRKSKGKELFIAGLPNFTLDVPSSNYEFFNYSKNTIQILKRARDIAASDTSFFNLISRSDPPIIMDRHILHAMLLIGMESQVVESSTSLPLAVDWLVELGLPLENCVAIFEQIPRTSQITPDLFATSVNSAFADAATEKDELGFEPYTLALAEIIAKPDTIPPVVIGVYGAWGSGKSTFMKLIKCFLEKWDKEQYPRGWKKFVNFFSRFAQWIQQKKEPKLPKIVCVEFDAWAHTDAAKVWANLLEKISERLDKELGFWKRIFFWLKKSTWRIIGAIILGLLPVIWYVTTKYGQPYLERLDLDTLYVNLIGWAPTLSGFFYLLSRGKPLTDIIKKVIGKMDQSEIKGVMNDVQEEIRGAIKKYFKLSEIEDKSPDPNATIAKKLRQEKLKVVIFIDELDRCPLEQIVDILEAIKIFLAEDIFIVLMAVDTRVVAEAISIHYKDVKNTDLAREYLEKIIQVPVQVPRGSDEQIIRFIDSLMSVPKNEMDDGQSKDLNIKAGKRTFSKLELNQRGRYVVTENPLKPLNLADTEIERDTFASFTSEYLDGNPRRIKRLLNTYRYIKILATRNGERTDQSAWQSEMIKWLVITMKWPVFMEFFIEELKKEENIHIAHTNALQEIKKNQLDIEAPEIKFLDELLPPDINRITEGLVTLANNFIAENPMRIKGEPIKEKLLDLLNR